MVSQISHLDNLLGLCIPQRNNSHKFAFIPCRDDPEKEAG